MGLGIEKTIESGRELRLRETYRSLYGSTQARLFRAPGRVNLIGEHTDYNDGYVMPAAIGFYAGVAAGRRDDRKLCVYSEQFQERVELELDSLEGPPRKHWSDYIRGVAAVLLSAGFRLNGVNLVLDSNVPLGAGLSSSAAIEVATAFGIAATSRLEISRLETAKLCQRAENEYSGARCGIMDQFISCFGREGHALMLDCRSLSYTHVPLPPDVRIVICNTMVKHEIAGGEYNNRRAACERSVERLRASLPGIRALRDVSFEDLERHRGALDETDYRRARHIITENERVLHAVQALNDGDIGRLGQLMYESHRSLAFDYEVSCDELNIMVKSADSIKGVYGARMTGGGFGGCTVNLVDVEAVDNFRSRILEQYRNATGRDAVVYMCSAAQGAGAVANGQFQS